MTEEIKKQIKTLGEQIEELGEKFPNLEQDELFTAWFLKAYLTSDEEGAVNALTARSGEKGADAIFLDTRAKIGFIVQTKYRVRGFGQNEPRSHVMAFAGLGPTVTDPDDHTFVEFLQRMPPGAVEKYKSLRRAIHRGEFRLHLLYVTSGSCSRTIQQDARKAARRGASNTSMEVLDGKRLLVLLKDYLDGAAPPIPTVDLPLEVGTGVRVNGVLQRYDQPNNLECWVVSVRGDAIADLYERGGTRLFARNIRGFLGGGSKVNRGMEITLDSEPDHFFYYNNGITIVCDTAERVSHRGKDLIRIGNPQVINGQQTTRMLASEEGRSNKASVLVKIVQVPRDAGQHEDRFDTLISRIVQATNWQNAISPSDLMANDRLQVDLEKGLRKYGFFYLRKRQTKGEARKLIGPSRYLPIKKEDLALAVAGCELDPIVPRSGKENLFSEEHYRDVFPNTDPLYYLPRYCLMDQVSGCSHGYPQRAYMKWLVLNFMWNELAPRVRSNRAAGPFLTLWKKQDRSLVIPLERAINLVYVQATRFYNANRGAGERVLDVSQFFRNKRGRDKEFLRYWHRRPPEVRAKLKRAISAVTSALAA